MVVRADGKFIVSVSGDNTIKIGNMQQMGEETTFTEPAIASADGRFVVSRSGENTIKNWNIAEGECTFTGRTSSVYQ